MDIVARPEETGGATRRRDALYLASGRRIGLAEFGDPDGLPVIALHGTPGSRLMFALSDGPARERGVRIIAPERPGYGLSTFKLHASLLDSAGDIRIVADQLGLDRFALIGVSGGGPFAVAAAAALGDRVARLALIGPVGPIADLKDQVRLSTPQFLLFRVLARSTVGPRLLFRALRYMTSRAPETAYRWLVRRVGPPDREILRRPEVKASLLAAVREGLRPGLSGALQDLRLFSSPWGIDLAAIQVPAQLWQGTADPIVPPQASYALSHLLPDCSLETIPSAGHYWVFGKFGDVLDALVAGPSAKSR